MKTTFFQTYQENNQLLGSDFTTIVTNCNTQRKLDNAIARHIKKINSLITIKPFLKGGFQVRYFSQYN